MFKIRFDPDSAKRQFNQSGSSGSPGLFNQNTMNSIGNACKLLARISPSLAAPGPLRNRLVAKWFKSDNNAKLFLYLVNLDNVIQDTNRTVTFVDGLRKRLTIGYTPDNIDKEPRWLDRPASRSEMNGVSAWVFPLPGTGARRQPSEYHVGSGIRIIFGPAILNSLNGIYELAGIIYHELTHKIIGTNDFEYEEASCLRLSAEKAYLNADNYNLFFQEFGKALDLGVRS